VNAVVVWGGQASDAASISDPASPLGGGVTPDEDEHESVLAKSKSAEALLVFRTLDPFIAPTMSHDPVVRAVRSTSRRRDGGGPSLRS